MEELARLGDLLQEERIRAVDDGQVHFPPRIERLERLVELDQLIEGHVRAIKEHGEVSIAPGMDWPVTVEPKARSSSMPCRRAMASSFVAFDMPRL